jgi:hypothetical protein
MAMRRSASAVCAAAGRHSSAHEAAPHGPPPHAQPQARREDAAALLWVEGEVVDSVGRNDLALNGTADARAADLLHPRQAVKAARWK